MREYRKSHRFTKCADCGAGIDSSINRCSECQPEFDRRQHLRRNYGITPEQYYQMLDAQGGGCGSCGATEVSASRRHMHVDHDHATGEVRGVLCHRCNVVVGLLREDVAHAEAILRYVMKVGK